MAYTTIRLKGSPQRDEAVANAEIYPGHLVELMSTGKLRVHSKNGSRAEKAFAFEDELQGKEISQAYAADAIVQYDIYRPGDIVLARLSTAYPTPNVGVFLCSNGDGTLRPCAADSSGLPASEDYAIGIVTEAAVGGLCPVRII